MNPNAEDDANAVQLILIENFECYRSKRGNFSKRRIFQKKVGNFRKGGIFEEEGKFLFMMVCRRHVYSRACTH